MCVGYACIFHVVFINFVRVGYPTQTLVEYGLYFCNTTRFYTFIYLRVVVLGVSSKRSHTVMFGVLGALSGFGDCKNDPLDLKYVILSLSLTTPELLRYEDLYRLTYSHLKYTLKVKF